MYPRTRPLPKTDGSDAVNNLRGIIMPVEADELVTMRNILAKLRDEPVPAWAAMLADFIVQSQGGGLERGKMDFVIGRISRAIQDKAAASPPTREAVGDERESTD